LRTAATRSDPNDPDSALTMRSDSAPIRRLTNYWKIEAGNAALIPAIAVYFVLRSGATITPALVLSGLACSFLLVIGTIVLRMMLRKARGEPDATKGRIALLAWMRAGYNVPKGREGTLITGISMGGMGSLRIAFKHPDKFQAVASMEPGIEPALAFKDVKLRDRFWRDDALLQSIYGKPVDEAYWAGNNPATIANTNPESLVGLGIYLEAGDQDMFFLHHGTEFLHRVLFDKGLSHEYRLVKGAEHVGPSIAPRFLDALTFLGRVLNPPSNWTEAPGVKQTRETVNGYKRAAGYPVKEPDGRRLRTE
jgi:pimeloyl-ACP methyl ester carboxylesterase